MTAFTRRRRPITALINIFLQGLQYSFLAALSLALLQTNHLSRASASSYIVCAGRVLSESESLLSNKEPVEPQPARQAARVIATAVCRTIRNVITPSSKAPSSSGARLNSATLSFLPNKTTKCWQIAESFSRKIFGGDVGDPAVHGPDRRASARSWRPRDAR